MSARPPARPPWVTAGLAVLFGSLLIFAIWILVEPTAVALARDVILYQSFLALGTALLIARAVTVPAQRLGWSLMAATACLWTLMGLAWSIAVAVTGADIPLVGEAALAVVFLLGCIAIITLGRSSMVNPSWNIILDGAITALGLSAFLFTLIESLQPWFSFGDSVRAGIVAMAMLVVLSLVIGVVGLLRGRTQAFWWLLAAGGLVLALTSLRGLLDSLDQAAIPSTSVEAGWLFGVSLFALAAWVDTTPVRAPIDIARIPILPSLVTVASFALLIAGTQATIPQLSVLLAAGTLILGGVRTGQAFRSASVRAELQRQALTDDLTGLANRRALNAALQQSDFGALLLLDIDGFKEINDALGHPAGDAVLQEVSHRLTSSFGRYDVVARLGGDEFAVLIGRAGADPTTAARRVQLAMKPPIDVTEVALQIDVSVGVARYGDHGSTLEELLVAADRAMYRAKTDRSGTVMYETDWGFDERGDLLLMQELRRALDDGDLTCYYQPQMITMNNEIAAVEALIRWIHPQQGVIPAAHFLPIAERTVLIRPLTEFVLTTAISQLADWHRSGLRLGLSVNLSATNLLDGSLPLVVTQTLSRFRIPAHYLTLEVTESVLMSDPARVRNVISQLHEIGVSLSIDDYGIGYSSLEQIRTLKARELKLDQSFVTGVGQRDDLQSIVRATVQLAHGLGLRLVAEGVESAADLDQLRLAGCDLAQGYFVCPPKSGADVHAWLLSQPMPWRGQVEHR